MKLPWLQQGGRIDQKPDGQRDTQHGRHLAAGALQREGIQAHRKDEDDAAGPEAGREADQHRRPAPEPLAHINVGPQQKCEGRQVIHRRRGSRERQGVECEQGDDPICTVEHSVRGQPPKRNQAGQPGSQRQKVCKVPASEVHQGSFEQLEEWKARAARHHVVPAHPDFVGRTRKSPGVGIAAVAEQGEGIGENDPNQRQVSGRPVSHSGAPAREVSGHPGRHHLIAIHPAPGPLHDAFVQPFRAPAVRPEMICLWKKRNTIRIGRVASVEAARRCGQLICWKP